MTSEKIMLILIAILHGTFTQPIFSEQANVQAQNEKDLLSNEIYSLCVTLVDECKKMHVHKNISFNDIIVENNTSLIIDSSILAAIRVVTQKATEVEQNPVSLSGKSKEELAKIKDDLLEAIKAINILKTAYCRQKNDPFIRYKQDLKKCLSTVLKVLISAGLCTLAKDSVLAPITHVMKMYYLCSLIFSGWDIVSSSTDAIAYYAIKDIHPNTIKSNL